MQALRCKWCMRWGDLDVVSGTKGVDFWGCQGGARDFSPPEKHTFSCAYFLCC